MVEPNEETQQILSLIVSGVSAAYTNDLAKFCREFYVGEDFDAEAIVDDIENCGDEGDSSGLIGAMEESSEFQAVVATDKQKQALMKVLKESLKGPPPQNKTFDLSEINWSLSSKDAAEPSKLIKQQCPNVFGKEDDKAFFDVVAIGNKNNIPIVTWLMDTFFRYRINAFMLEQRTVGIPEFVSEYALFKDLRASQSKKMVHKLESVFATFGKRFCPDMSLTQTFALVDDDLNEFADYYIAMHGAIESLIKGANKGLVPCQIDFWVIPKNVTSSEAFDDDVDPEDEEDAKSGGGGGGDDGEDIGIDCIGNLEHRLRSNGYTYTKSDMDLEHAKRLFAQGIDRQVNGARNQRIMVYLDRRNPNAFDKMSQADFEKFVACGYGDDDEENARNSTRTKLKQQRNGEKEKSWKDRMYVVQSKHAQYRQLPARFRDFSAFFMSSECLLPQVKQEQAQRSKPFGCKDLLGGYQYVLSWQIEDEQLIKCYWYFNGQVTRLFAGDVLSLWPKSFTGAQEINANKAEILKEMSKQSFDAQFENWYNQTTAKKLF
uniref:Uncharacterized protein n=1 Tax=Elphidium margaritaceum TaxID=933848 RepID=A0A7S0TEF2_9EUKA|mmetsp:Transcript_1833/g.3596  ORF Transcript_1833/g.3596 Transcript_1833/m.3596 type:complete len:545 (+) Transcript_1833:48-1682(+)|eukprot:CAMPEP_0202693346 /NCGR_PEP_ID=MMETSP1385-20130828/7493_1 /ASSEMBLY_ACC=CAM_ASM_000861 /TAXON_ID=933848 /ORGANISM="Elphidium margaritaceum" /LENGTH=544 /DNA_ID=CAMNT_0049349017 /DNA_START=38 /DNA_END=1672 /DNA_ORIENTATION=+